jgi:hypothetical protein
MLLAIDQKKVDEQLAAITLGYVVNAFNVETAVMAPPESPSTDVYSTVAGLPPDVERVRARLFALRQRVIDSGVKPLSADELDR